MSASMFSPKFPSIFPAVLDTLFREGRPSSWSQLDAVPAMDAYRRDGNVVVLVDLPGVRREDVTLEVDNGWVVVSAERPYAPEPGDDVLRSERAFGRFERRFRIGAGATAESVSATMADGVLTITIGQSAVSSSMKIDITAPTATAERAGE